MIDYFSNCNIVSLLDLTFDPARVCAIAPPVCGVVYGIADMVSKFVKGRRSLTDDEETSDKEIPNVSSFATDSIWESVDECHDIVQRTDLSWRERIDHDTIGRGLRPKVYTESWVVHGNAEYGTNEEGLIVSVVGIRDSEFLISKKKLAKLGIVGLKTGDEIKIKESAGRLTYEAVDKSESYLKELKEYGDELMELLWEEHGDRLMNNFRKKAQKNGSRSSER